MEMIYYKCETCGFVHQVPAYWSGYAPEEELEMAHIDLKTKAPCSDTVLKRIKS